MYNRKIKTSLVSPRPRSTIRFDSDLKVQDFHKRMDSYNVTRKSKQMLREMKKKSNEIDGCTFKPDIKQSQRNKNFPYATTFNTNRTSLKTLDSKRGVDTTSPN